MTMTIAMRTVWRAGRDFGFRAGLGMGFMVGAAFAITLVVVFHA